MPRGPKGEKRPADVNARAVMIGKIATGEIEDITTDDGKNAAAVALGRMGGKARAKGLSAKKRLPAPLSTMRTSGNIASKKVQCDEIWSFCYAKKRNVAAAKAAPDGAGDVWTFSALDADSKLMISWMVGARDGVTAYHFMRDLRRPGL